MDFFPSLKKNCGWLELGCAVDIHGIFIVSTRTSPAHEAVSHKHLAAIICVSSNLLLEHRNSGNYVCYNRNCVLSTFPQKSQIIGDCLQPLGSEKAIKDTISVSKGGRCCNCQRPYERIPPSSH